MRWILIQLSAPVILNDVLPIDIQLSVWIYWHHHFSNESVDTALLKPENNKQWTDCELWYSKQAEIAGNHIVFIISDECNEF